MSQIKANTTRRTRSAPQLLSGLILLVLLAMTVGGLKYKQQITDAIALAGYHAPSEVSQLADNTGMTTAARHDFYVNHPQILDRATFSKACASHGEQTIVLGCYHGNQNGIFVFRVVDSRLQGVEQVTAAHEMLHAAYDRLSITDRTQVDSWLQDYYSHDLHDERLRTTIQAYQKSEPHDVINEMHSVFGTEASNLPPNLEAYYKRYFINRAQVVAYANAYQAEFTDRQNQVTTDDHQLHALQQQISNNNTQLAKQQIDLAERKQQLDSLRASNNLDQYNAAVPGYNADINSYNQLATTTRQMIDSYNQLVKTRNDIALQVNQLANAINSSPQALTN